MQKLYSQCIGMPVFDEYTRAVLGFIQNLFIDPENGKVLAFVLKKDFIIVPLDVEHINSGLYIAGKDRILSIQEVLRVKEVAHCGIHLIGSKVLTDRSKTLLGRAIDFEIDTKTMVLTKLYVAKLFFFFRFQEKILPAKQIVKILQDKIIVKELNEAVAVKKIHVRSQAFAA